jgi:hypothetical protein
VDSHRCHRGRRGPVVRGPLSRRKRRSGGHLHKLPAGLVNADEGAVGGGKHVNLGARTTWSIMKSVVGGDKTDWKVMDEKEVKEELGKGKLFGARVVPDDFTSCTCALIGTAAENASLQVGTELTAQSGAQEAKLPAAARLLLADPADVTVKDGHPLDSHRGLGLTAFYYALTLANGSTLMAGLSLLMGTLVMAGAVGLMGMDASHLPLLWLYLVCAIAVVLALETQLRRRRPSRGAGF